MFTIDELNILLEMAKNVTIKGESAPIVAGLQNKIANLINAGKVKSEGSVTTANIPPHATPVESPKTK